MIDNGETSVRNHFSNHFCLRRLTITAARLMDSVSGIAVPQTLNSGIAVLTDDVDELVLVV